MAMVLARLMGEMDLLVVVIGEPTMRLLDLLPADRLIEAMVSNSPHDPNYVEYSRHSLKTLQ